MNRQINWFGIDFGTTNSAAVSFTGADMLSVREIDCGDDEGRPFPSLVAINVRDGSVITGREAKERKNELSSEYKFFSSIKSIIGNDEPYEIAGRKWKPVDIAAEILKGLKRNISESRGLKCDEAIVAVPVGFTADKKKNLREAAKKAGINVKMFISEPTAAFCSNYINLKGNRYVAVFDWGGGTLDIAVLKVEDGKVYELATDGMNVAGDDIDRLIADKIHAWIAGEKGIRKELKELDDITKDTLLMRCERVKCSFSDGDEVATIRVNRYDEVGAVRQVIEYDFFAELISPIINDAVSCLEGAIKKAGLMTANIDRILCVGGSSKLLPLRKKLEGIYGNKMLFYPEKVMWDIAKGAAVVSMSSGKFGLNQDLGLILDDGEFFPLIKSGQTLPCRERKLNFAITNDENHAKFVVTDAKEPEKRSFTQYITVPAGGFMKEQFELACFIDPDHLFRLSIRSTQFMKQYLHFWTYDKLKIFYQIEG